MRFEDFQVVVCNGRNTMDARLAMQSKTEIHNACTRKTQRTQSILFFACDAVRCIFRMHELCLLCTTAWIPTFKSIFCILMAVALFLHSTHVGQPAIAKLLFHDGWAVCEIQRSTLVRDIIIKAPTLNKWTPVSASACGGLTCRSPVARHTCTVSTLLHPWKKNKPSDSGTYHRF